MTVTIIYTLQYCCIQVKYLIWSCIYHTLPEWVCFLDYRTNIAEWILNTVLLLKAKSSLNAVVLNPRCPKHSAASIFWHFWVSISLLSLWHHMTENGPQMFRRMQTETTWKPMFYNLMYIMLVNIAYWIDWVKITWMISKTLFVGIYEGVHGRN